MPFNLLLLILLGGYGFTSLSPALRYRAARLDRTRLVLLAMGVGFVLLLPSRALVESLISVMPGFADWWKQQVPHPYSGTAVITLLLGPTLGFIHNAIVTDDKRLESARKAFDATNAYFELLVLRAGGNKQIMITTKSRKVYVGFVVHTITPDNDTKSIELLPTISGYRREPDLAVEFTTDYLAVYDRLQSSEDGPTADDFSLVVPVDEIQSATLFEPDVYVTFNPLTESDTPSRYAG